MPRAKNSRKKGPFNNVQTQLTTRLMQISLRMDDHIYYNNPLSREAAEEFLQEVDALKLKCPRKDVRSLQVIDKLSLFMKKIIAETQEPVTDLSPTINAYTGYSQSHSPVYSLPDEDRIETEMLCSDVPINDLTEKSDDSNPREQNNVIDNVNVGISNLSIHGLQDELLNQAHDLPADACSQSILDNYYNSNVTCNDGNNLGTIHITVASNEISLTPASNELSNHYSENASLYATISKQGVVGTEKGIENSNKKIIDLGNEIAAVSFPKDEQKDRTEKKKKTAQRRKTKNTIKGTKKRKPNSENFTVDGATEVSCKPNKVNKYKKTKHENNSLKAVSREPEVNGRIKIYNRNVENDLSWVENLRYVREIGPDENDPTLCHLEDNFWNNFSLPGLLNDLDFYT